MNRFIDGRKRISGRKSRLGLDNILDLKKLINSIINSSGSTSLTADNGISINSSIIELGGSLNQNTSINNAGNTLEIIDSTSNIKILSGLDPIYGANGAYFRWNNGSDYSFLYLLDGGTAAPIGGMVSEWDDGGTLSGRTISYDDNNVTITFSAENGDIIGGTVVSKDDITISHTNAGTAQGGFIKIDSSTNELSINGQYTLPFTAGTQNQVLQLNNSGNLLFQEIKAPHFIGVNAVGYTAAVALGFGESFIVVPEKLDGYTISNITIAYATPSGGAANTDLDFTLDTGGMITPIAQFSSPPGTHGDDTPTLLTPTVVNSGNIIYYEVQSVDGGVPPLGLSISFEFTP